MDIIDVIKSGKPFRRRCFYKLERYELKHGILMFYDMNNKGHSTNELKFTVTEILADDWEVIEQTITITESQFKKIAMGSRVLFNIDQAWEELVHGVSEK